MCSCGAEIESTELYLLCCQNYTNEISELFKGTCNLTSGLPRYIPNERLENLHWCGSEDLRLETKEGLIKFTINFIKSSQRFNSFLTLFLFFYYFYFSVYAQLL